MKKIFPYIAFLSLTFILATACSTKAKKVSDYHLSPIILERISNPDTIISVPEGLSKEDQIAYIENHVLTSPISADELLALSPIHTLDDPDLAWLPSLPTQGDAQVQMANRFMRMQYVALGDPMDELQWVIAVQTILKEYATNYKVTMTQALDDMLGSVEYLAAGTMPEINRYCYIAASVEYYKTLAVYYEFLQKAEKSPLQELLRDEYVAWNKLNKARHNAYVNIVRAGEWYSALPMEYEGQYAAYAQRRRELLSIETDILYGNTTYRKQHPLVRTADWDNYIKNILNGTIDDYAEIAAQVDTTVRVWLQIRQSIARQLPAAQATSYDNLTADYHWLITNNDEPIPPGYD